MLIRRDGKNSNRKTADLRSTDEPLLRALQVLGDSGSVVEIYDKVVELEGFPEEVVAQPHDPERSNQTEVGYRLAWARIYLKKYGLLDNSNRGIWSLTAKAKELER